MTNYDGNIRITDVNLGKRHRNDLGDLHALIRSIRTVGLLHPIVVTPDGRLVAGARRLEAHKRMGRTEIPARIVPVPDIVRGELEENTVRKDFTPSERVDIARALRDEEQSAAKKRQGQRTDKHPGKFPEGSAGQARDKIGAYVGVSGRTLEKMEAIVDAAERDPKKYGRMFDEMERSGRVNSAFRRLVVARKAETIRDEPPPWPDGPFRVIVADPPWSYESLMLPYPTMAVEQIKELPVSRIAADDCALWLWTTSFHMRESFDVLDTWGFAQKTILTWVKDRMGCGDWLRGKTEHCLLAIKGKPIITLTNQTTVLFGPMRDHSQKPDEFYDLVESLCPAPEGGRVELFQRKPRPGWVGHGDEARSAGSLVVVEV